MLSAADRMSKMKLEKCHVDFANQRPLVAGERRLEWVPKKMRGEKVESARTTPQEILL